MKYSLPSRILHWIMAVIILGLLGVGIYMTEFLDRDSANRMLIYGLHKSFGVIVLILIFARVINRFINKPPALPNTIKKSERIGAHIGHIILYVLMFAVPLSGYLMSNSYGYPVKLFGLPLPFIVEKDFEVGKFFSSAHFYFGYGLLVVVIIHIAAVVKHRFFDQKENDVLKRMI
ncbi:MAG: cytochrome b [Rickettsiales bacterium]|nr:cytochrome b [Rickettsiales bacterium]